jgi:hypothetical protein
MTFGGRGTGAEEEEEAAVGAETGWWLYDRGGGGGDGRHRREAEVFFSQHLAFINEPRKKNNLQSKNKCTYLYVKLFVVKRFLR